MCPKFKKFINIRWHFSTRLILLTWKGVFWQGKDFFSALLFSLKYFCSFVKQDISEQKLNLVVICAGIHHHHNFAIKRMQKNGCVHILLEVFRTLLSILHFLLVPASHHHLGLDLTSPSLVSKLLWFLSTVKCTACSKKSKFNWWLIVISWHVLI